MALGAYGSSKSSSSGSSSYLSGSHSGSDGSKHSGGMGSSSTPSSGSSCTCEFLIEVDLTADNQATLTVTNIGTCDLSVLSIFWDGGGSAGDTAAMMPVELPPGVFQEFTIEESYDIRGLTGSVSTTCYEAGFSIPES